MLLFSITLPFKDEISVIKKQFIRSSTSVGANYRAALRAKSTKDFIYKIDLIIEEADETCYWLELLYEIKKSEKILELHKEANELTAIFTAIAKTTKAKNKS